MNACTARGAIGATDRLARATALGLGAHSEAIAVVATDSPARDVAGWLAAELARS